MTTLAQAGGVVDLNGDDGQGQAQQQLPPGSRELLKYDPKQVKLIYAGIPVHIGAVVGTFITVERTKPSYRLVKGTDGEGTRVRTQDFSSRVMLTIRSGGGINDALSAVSATDDLIGTMALPLFLTDFGGRSTYLAPLAFLEGPTDVAFSTDEGANTWTWICDTWLPFTGGSNRAVPRPDRS